MSGEQSRQDTVRGEHARGMVGNRNPRNLRIAQIRNQAQHSAQRLADGVEAGIISIWPALAKPCDRAMNQPWIESAELLVIEAERGSRLSADVFD
jgi:hypothetical protein